MRIVVDGERPRCAVLTIAGDLDLASADELSSAGQKALDEGACEILILDLSAVDFIDSVGLGSLVAVRNSTIEKGVKLKLRRPTPAVRRLLEIANLDTVFDLSDP